MMPLPASLGVASSSAFIDSVITHAMYCDFTPFERSAAFSLLSALKFRATAFAVLPTKGPVMAQFAFTFSGERMILFIFSAIARGTSSRNAGSGIMCIENDRLCGLPVFCHSAIGEGNIGLGDFRYQVAGQFGDFYFIVDPYTGAASNMVKFTLNVDFGTATVRPEVYTLLKASV